MSIDIGSYIPYFLFSITILIFVTWIVGLIVFKKEIKVLGWLVSLMGIFTIIYIFLN